MNKNVIIAALVALLIGIGIGFSMAQINRPDTQQPAATQQPASAEAASSGQADTDTSSGIQATEQSSAQASDAESSAEQSSIAESSSSQSTQDSSSTKESNASFAAQNAEVQVDEDGTYTSKEEVAAYIHLYGHLPSNFVSKSKAKKAGWVSSKGNLQDVLPGMSIGGSEFYNNEGQLPDAPGRTWTECDINYEGGFRGAERIVFSDDGLIFYTSDHYKTFEQLY